MTASVAVGKSEDFLAKEIRQVTILGLVANLALSAVKFGAGIFSDSQALVADSIHSLSDSATDVAVIAGVGYWTKPPDQDHPFGHRRIETVIASLIGLALLGVGVFIGYTALGTINERHTSPPGALAFFAAMISIVVKEALYRWTFKAGQELKSPALKVNAWHHRSDAFSSVPVAVAVGISIFFPHWSILDHVAALMVAIFIIQAAGRIFIEQLNELLDAGAPEKDLLKIKELVLSCEGVRDVHAIRSRYLASNMVLDLHVMVHGSLSVTEGHEIAGKVKSCLLKEDFGLVDVLIHIEPFEEKVALQAATGTDPSLRSG